MKGRAQRLRAVALLAAGAAAVHQLRYAIGFGHYARHALAAQGHGYLAVALPFVAALGLFALAAMLRAPLAGTRDQRASLARAWATTAVALVAAYAAQELLEGLLAAGHPGGFAGVFGAGGWTAVPLAGVVAFLIALGLRGDGAVAEYARARVRACPPPPSFVMPRMGALAMPLRGAIRRAPARGPPLLTVS